MPATATATDTSTPTATDTDPRGRVLHVAHHALPHVGGLETVVEAEARALARRGWRVTVLSSAAGSRPGVARAHGVRRVRVRAWNGLEERHGVPFPVFSPALLPRLTREVRRADVVHVHDALYLSSWVAAACCRLLGTPYVVHRHVGFVHHSSALVRLVQRAVLATLGRMVLRGAARVLAIDEHVASGLRGAVPDPARVEVLGNGVDTERFRPADAAERRRLRERFGLPHDEPLVLFVGRFVPKKGFPAVVAAAAAAYRIVLAGGERPAGVDDPRLTFLGSVAPDEVADLYRCADALVVPSVGECPLTVLEGLASGLPLVLNDDPALRSPWTAGPGVRFVDVAAGGLAAALAELVADPAAARADGLAGRAYVSGSFSWRAHVDRLERTYRRVNGLVHPRNHEVSGALRRQVTGEGLTATTPARGPHR